MTNRNVKGSALYLEDGGLIFTPYNQNSQKSIWRKLIVVDNGKLRATNDIVQITITAKRNASATRMMMGAFASLMLKLPELL